MLKSMLSLREIILQKNILLTEYILLKNIDSHIKEEEMLEWIIQMRKETGLSQYKMAELSGISQSFYAAIETGRRSPSIKVAKRIAEVLGFEWTLFFEDR